jgi:type IV secretion system protein VirB9
MKPAHIFALLLAGTMLATHAASAEIDPAPGPEDSRMRNIAYDPNQVYHLSTAAGATLVVSFAPDETVTQVAVTDSKDLKASPAKNFLFFKSQTPLSPQPVVVLTTNTQGQMRRYVFEVTALNTTAMGAGSPGIYYSVQFTYPADEAARRRATALAAWKQRQAAATAQAAQQQAALAHQTLEDQAKDPFSGPRNWKYVGKGAKSLAPLNTWDNGFSTVFEFPGNMRMPAILMINPDGKEATPNYVVKGNLIEVDAVAKQWRLRDGNTVLCVFNRAFNPIGNNPGTGTTSADVLRVTHEAPP